MKCTLPSKVTERLIRHSWLRDSIVLFMVKQLLMFRHLDTYEYIRGISFVLLAEVTFEFWHDF